MTTILSPAQQKAIGWTNISGWSTTNSTSTITFSNNTVTGTNYATGGYITTSWGHLPKRVRNGKYQVRCKGCSRWAKIIEEKVSHGYMTWKVNCERCLGENEGFAP